MREGHGVAVVTGASSGIGAATARALAAAGYAVVAVARRRERLEAVVERCRATAPASEAVVCDLRDEAASRAVVEGVLAKRGRLDVLVHAAGIPMRRRLDALSMHDVREVLEVNYLAPVAMTLAALPSMREAARGSVVFVSSLVGRLGNPGEAAYAATKFALCGFAESASMELAGSGVEVRLVLPGPIDTEIWDVDGQDPSPYDGERFPPELVADAIVAAIASSGVEHYVPDLRAIVEFKTADFDAFRDGMVDAVRAAAVRLPDEDA